MHDFVYLFIKGGDFVKNSVSLAKRTVFFSKRRTFWKKQRPFWKKRAPFWAYIYARCLFTFLLAADRLGVTSGVTSGATNFFVMDIDFQWVKCQVWEVSPTLFLRITDKATKASDWLILKVPIYVARYSIRRSTSPSDAVSAWFPLPFQKLFISLPT